jgi:hypothetical protein
MNCQNFEKNIDDLARDQIMAAAAREAAAAHAASCARCAARLGDERALTAGLRAVARSAETKQAPARIEAALLASFRERRSAPLTKAASPALGPAPTRRWSRWALAAAAAVLLVAALVLARFERTPPHSAPPALAHQTKPADQEKTQAPAQAEPVGENAPASARADAAEGRKGQSVLARVKPRPARRSDLAARRGDRSTRTDSMAQRVEIATEFLPLVNGPDLAPSDGGHVVRVELPRSALVSLGLPMNVERADERIKADVLFGNDGLARAVRFVR